MKWKVSESKVDVSPPIRERPLFLKALRLAVHLKFFLYRQQGERTLALFQYQKTETPSKRRKISSPSSQ